MSELKVAFLLTQSLDSPSGLGRFGPLARELAHRGHQVEIYALHPEFESLQPMYSQSGEPATYYVAPMHIKKSGSTKTYYSSLQLLPIVMQASIKLTQGALRSPADILHICKPHPMNSIAGLLGHAFKGKTIYLDCDDYEAGIGNFSSGWQKSLVSTVETHMPRRVESVTTNTHFMQNKLISWGVSSERITYIPNGVELSRFKPPQQDNLLHVRQKLELTGKQVISYIGTVGFTSHPVNILMNAFALIQDQQQEAILLIVGGGEDLEALRDQARQLGLEHKVRFTGRIPPQEVSIYYYLSDISVDPVHDDDAARGRSPLKLFESWACGIPFVTADVGDRSELIGSPPAGLLARGGDASSLADKLRQLIVDPDLASRLRQAGLERVKRYSWESLTGTLEELYLENR